MQMRPFLFSKFLSCVLVLFAGCSTPYGTPESNPSNVTFPGLASLIADAGGVPIDVLSVHGMCSHDKSWVLEVVDQIGAALDLDGAPPRQTEVVEGIEIWQSDLRDGSDQIVVRNFALLWSSLTNDVKQSLCYDASEATPSCPVAQFDGKRASLNSALKSELMNDCFSDALIYLGDRGQTIRRAMRAAIAAIGDIRRGANRPLILVTESLGSKVVADAVIGSSGEQRSSTLEALRGTQVIFMAANQIPLLNLAHPGDVRAADRESAVVSLRDFIQREVAAFRESEDVYIVALSDPNDLLTYELATETDRTTINVRVSNARTYFGWIANPKPAHRGYLSNPRVWRLIVCGTPDLCD